MKKIMFALLLSAGLLSQADPNLLQNGDFNGDNFLSDILILQDYGKVKVFHFTENQTWNRCIKMEISGFKQTGARKQISTSLLFGKTGSSCGVQVQPDTWYRFRLDLKGNRGVSLWAVMFDSSTSQIWKGESVRLTPPTATPTPNSWTVFRGYFKTGPKTKFASLKLVFEADSQKMKKIPEVGDYIMIDNIRIVKNRGPAPALSGNAAKK